MLASNKVLIASDETGFPAAARILENLTPMVEGELIFETQDGSALYPFECPQLMRIRWLSRDKGENLKDETIKAISDNHGAKIWFAGEKEQANLVREEARNVLVGDMNLHHICELPLRKAFDFFNTLNLEGNKAQVANKLVNEINIQQEFDLISMEQQKLTKIWQN